MSDTLYKTIQEKIDSIQDRISNWKTDISLDGKNLQSAVVEQPSLLAYYDQIAVEAEYFMDLMEMQVKKVRAERTKFIRDNFSKEYTDSAIQKLIDGDDQYIKAYRIYLLAKENYDRCKALVEGFKQRSYSLNNIVKIREHELENITIRL